MKNDISEEFAAELRENLDNKEPLFGRQRRGQLLWLLGSWRITQKMLTKRMFLFNNTQEGKIMGLNTENIPRVAHNRKCTALFMPHVMFDSEGRIQIQKLLCLPACD